jgi:hypothetical protein
MNCDYLDNLWISAQISIGKNAFKGRARLKYIQVTRNIAQEIIDTWGLSENCAVERYDNE